jgi:hypothetical protein
MLAVQKLKHFDPLWIHTERPYHQWMLFFFFFFFFFFLCGGGGGAGE